MKEFDVYELHLMLHKLLHERIGVKNMRFFVVAVVVQNHLNYYLWPREKFNRKNCARLCGAVLCR